MLSFCKVRYEKHCQNQKKTTRESPKRYKNQSQSHQKWCLGALGGHLGSKNAKKGFRGVRKVRPGRFLVPNGSQRDPKWEPKPIKNLFQNQCKNRCPKKSKNDAKMIQTWSQNEQKSYPKSNFLPKR